MTNINSGKRLCIGCGICAGICEHITMKMDEMGAYCPNVDVDHCTNCGKCIRVCPFSEDVKNEDEFGELLYKSIEQMKWGHETGYYLNCYEGFIKTHRDNSASGGVVTFFLEQCLTEKFVDEVVCVGSCQNEGRLFEYTFVTSPADLKKNSRSAYYPVELSGVLRRIKKSNNRVAITTLPCVAKAIRLASQYDKRLRDNIKIVVALTCGGLPKEAMVDYVAKKNGFSSSEIQELKFRVKHKEYLNKNYCMQMVQNNKVVISRFHGDDFGFAYLNKLFHHTVCNCCDDVFGECADISFMDAWLAEYDQDTLGTSIVITRSRLADQIMHNIKVTGGSLSGTSIDRAIKAQNNVGLINRKKQTAYYRTRFYKRRGYLIGGKRKAVLSLKRKIVTHIRTYMEYKLQQKSARLWRKVISNQMTIDKYDEIIKRVVSRNKNLLRKGKR